MLNTPTPARTNSNIRRFALAEHRVEEKLPITDEARHGLSSLWIGLAGTLMMAAIIAIVQLVS